MKDNSASYKMFSIANTLLLLLLALSCVAPLAHLLAVSFSSRAAANANLIKFWPVGFTLSAYVETLGNRSFVKAAWIGLLRTIIGPVFSLIITSSAAYSLSKEKNEFRYRSIYMWFFVFAMLFTGGLIPTYMVIKNTGLMNSFWVLIFPSALNVFNIILLLNFFRTSIPRSLGEAAFIDGASNLTTFTRIYFPLALPAIATITLFNIVFHWNSYFDGLIYMTDSSKFPLATFLLTIVVTENYSTLGLTVEKVKNISERTIKASQIFLSIIPVLMAYPFLQRYFIKGIVLGSVKE